MLIDTVRYELPPHGITLLGYIVRRMHKTERLIQVPNLLALGKTMEALEQIALFTAASSASYGRAYYQPKFNEEGDIIHEPDPVTGAMVTAQLISRSPHYRIACEVNLPNGDLFQGNETITGTSFGLRGLAMPAPSQFSFSSGDYRASLTGLITSELALSLLGRTRIRAFGNLNFEDKAGNKGTLELQRSGDVVIRINASDARVHALPATLWTDETLQV